MSLATKRKADGLAAKAAKRTKKAIRPEEAKERFRRGLFGPSALDGYTAEYAASAPYKHAVIHELVNDALLRAVRDEIRDNVSFTPKETDIYKIHQSGDLANLDGLEDEALAKLPSLLSLRDALYSETFRDYVSHITGCGPLSGRKTDMAINVYTPGSYLLCHDDVIGSRKVSYILYLTDPDTPWQSEWGGALRLFPVVEKEGDNGEVARTPAPDPVKVIPPAWNQLSFFAVQPGESFHDVEEVYHAASTDELERNAGRVRMAISGWFHIPQPGEAGFVEGAEAAQLKNSGLMQLQGNPDQHDRPQLQPVAVGGATAADEAATATGSHEFSEADLEFLLQYLTPSYLTPDTLVDIAEHFDENSSITLPSILKASFAERLRVDIEKREKEVTTTEAWHVAHPPHKHRFMYLRPGDAPKDSPWYELLDVLLPSAQFRTWLEMATSTTISSYDVTARRFRRGKDYTLATSHEGEERLELNLGLTPTEGWGDENSEEEDEGEEEEEEEAQGKGKGKSKAAAGEKRNDNAKSGKSSSKAAEKNGDGTKEDTEVEVGGHEVYMGGDDDANDDAAIYRSSNDDDNILFFQAAAWNKMTIVLRDSGTLRFVKYISRKAPGDRWDVSATFDVEPVDNDDDDDEGAANDANGANGANGVNGEGSSSAQQLLESSEEEFNGFSSSNDSDSD